MELVYLWVEKYKNIEKQGFNFSPRFECSYDEEKNELTIDENKEYVSIFPKNINITAIVGENGSGKSSVLNFITKQDEYLGTFVFWHKEELLIFSKNILQISNIIINTTFKVRLNQRHYVFHSAMLFLKSYIDINTYEMANQLNIPRRFFQFSDKRDFIADLHKNTVELFNIISINTKKNLHESFETDPYTIIALNQHFSYLRDTYIHKVLKYYSTMEYFISKYFKIEKVKYHVRDLGNIFKLSPAFKNSFKQDEFLLKMSELFNQGDNIENKLKILSLIFCYLDEPEIKKVILLNQRMEYEELYTKIKKEYSFDYFIKWDNFIHILNTEENFKIIIEKYLIVLQEIRREILEFSFSPNLSSGEEKLLYLFVNIYDYIVEYQKIGITHYSILVDEPDTLLHPNWQKKVIYLFETFFDLFFQNCTFDMILTTHSPFFLSDLPKENIIFLEKYKENDNDVKNGEQKVGNCKNVTKEVDIQTFGANIHTLLSHGFFMKDGLIGEFAKEKINEIIDFLKKVEEEKVKKDADFTHLKQEYEKKKKRFWYIQTIIGEEYLRQVIKNHLVEIEKILLGKDKAKQEQIERLQKEIELLQKIPKAEDA